MRLATLLYFVIFFCSTSIAQNHFGYLGVGANLARSERQNFEYYLPILGPNVDLGYAYRKNGWVSSSTVGFQQKGYRQRLLLVDTLGTIIGEGPVETNYQNYFYLSQHIGYEIEKEWLYSINVGINFSRYYSTKISVPTYEYNENVTLYGYSFTTKNLTKNDISLSTSLGFGRNNQMIVLGYQWSLNKINYATFPSNFSWKNHVLSLRYVAYLNFQGLFGGDT